MFELFVAAMTYPFVIGPCEFRQRDAFQVTVVVPVEVGVETCVVVDVVRTEFFEFFDDTWCREPFS